MADRDLHHLQPRSIELSCHLHADHAACGLQRDDFENATANQAEIAIHVANRQPEGKAHCSAIRRPDPDPVPGIGAFHLVSVNEIDVWPELSQKVVDFANVILSVSVGIEDQILSGIPETGNESGSISKILRMVDRADEGKFPGKPICNGACPVLASVINDNVFRSRP